jgi:hypothetical protein
MARTEGVELIQQLHDGRLRQVEPEEIRRIRNLITQEIEEILEVGARVRPLYVENQMIGWARGVHLSERKQLKRFIFDKIEFTRHVLKLGTSLSEEFIKGLSALELRTLVRVVTEMTHSDLRLYPYVSPFVTTSTSEQLWFARGTALTAYQKKVIELPDGTTMPLLAAPDQARLWASLCNYREKAKARLDASMNALLIVRPWAGKSADGLASDLKNTAKSLIPDRMEPWAEIVKTPHAVNFNDGWAHGEDDSREGVLRELEGMMNNDRHERVMKQFEDSLISRAEAQQQTITEKIKQRGGPGFFDQKVTYGTESEIRKRVAEIRKRISRSSPIETEQSQAARLKLYQ